MVNKIRKVNGWMGLFLILFFGTLFFLILDHEHPSHAATESSVWGNKPVLEHIITNPNRASELKSELGLTDSELDRVVQIALIESNQVRELESESLIFLKRSDLSIAQKRQHVSAMGYNEQLSRIISENQNELQVALGIHTYSRLINWIEEKWEKDRNHFASSGLPANILNFNVVPGFKTYPRSFEVYATRYDAGDRYIVALPDKCLKFANGGAMLCNSGYQYGQNYSVAISYKGKTVYATVGESGPWNIDDNYWAKTTDPQPRRMFADLPMGVPEAQAAYFNGYNGGVDQFGRVVTSPVAIDISYAVAEDLGLPSGNNKVTVSFLWTEVWDSPAAENGTSIPTPLPVTPVVASTANPDGSITHIVQEGQNLSGIAKIYDLSIQELLAINDLTMDSIILPGDRIIIKLGDPTPSITTTVKKTSNTPNPTETSEFTSTPTIIQTIENKGNEIDSTEIGEASSELSRRDTVVIIIAGAALLGVISILLGVIFRRR